MKHEETSDTGALFEESVKDIFISKGYKLIEESSSVSKTLPYDFIFEYKNEI